MQMSSDAFLHFRGMLRHYHLGLYHSLLRCRQNPQCEGINQNRIFLDNHTASSHRAFYFIRHTSGDVYDIDAGEAHGVTVGAEFAVYDDKTCINELGRLVVSETSAFQSSLCPVEGGQSFDTPQTGAFGILTRIGTIHDVRLFVQLSDELAGVFTAIARHMRTKSPYKPTFKLVNKREENPDLIVTANEDGTVRFEVTDKICRDVGLREISFRPTSDSATMSNVLRGVADFYWNFHCTSNGEHVISPRIDFECYELVENDVMEPIGGNLFVNGSIQIDICSDDSKPYGFCIRNTSTIPLFISMFYFSMSDLSIGESLRFPIYFTANVTYDRLVLPTSIRSPQRPFRLPSSYGPPHHWLWLWRLPATYLLS